MAAVGAAGAGDAGAGCATGGGDGMMGRVASVWAELLEVLKTGRIRRAKVVQTKDFMATCFLYRD